MCLSCTQQISCSFPHTRGVALPHSCNLLVCGGSCISVTPVHLSSDLVCPGVEKLLICVEAGLCLSLWGQWSFNGEEVWPACLLFLDTGAPKPCLVLTLALLSLPKLDGVNKEEGLSQRPLQKANQCRHVWPWQFTESHETYVFLALTWGQYLLLAWCTEINW